MAFGNSADVTAGTDILASQYNDLREDVNALPRDMGRQAIINGNFDVWQRGVTFTPSSSGTYTADRWFVGYATGGGTLPTDTITRQQITAGELFGGFYHLRLAVDGAGTGFGATSNYSIGQNIEHGTRYLCGASKTVTVSFWAKSDISSKKLGVFLLQTYGTGGTPTSAETINGTNWTLTSTWTKYTHTFTTNTLSGKTFGTNNNNYLQLCFQVMWGTDYDDRVGASGAEDFVGSGNIDIAQVQLNSGSTALDFYPRSFGEELRLCQRYFYKITSTTAGEILGVGSYNSTTQFTGAIILPVPLRDGVSSTDSGDADFTVLSTGSNRAVTSGLSSSCSAVNSNYVRVIATTGATTAGYGGEFRFTSGTAGYYIQWDAEI